MTATTFKNRKEAAKQLAEKIAELNVSSSRTLILAIHSSAIPIAQEISRSLNVLFDVLIAHKIPAPHNPEIGIGAMASPNVVMIDAFAQDSFDIADNELEEIIAQEKKEMERVQAQYSKREGEVQDSYDTIVIVDDGLATEAMLRVAIASATQMFKPRALHFATPICSRDVSVSLKGRVDSIMCLSELDDVIAINLWYDEEETSLRT